jgi:prepilin-type N-terminal cleavage/methylation domain-containing protein
MRCRYAFSLVELLVVLGIVSLLAALLYPTFAAAREKARTTRCLTQLRQLAHSTQMYLTDHDDTYPLAAFFSTHDGQRCFFTLYHALVPYVKDKQIVVCPSDPNPFDIQWALEQVSMGSLCPAMGFRHSSYMANWCLIETGALLGNFHPPVPAALVEFPAETVLYYDGGITGLPSLSPFIQARHLERLGVVLADGHSKAWRAREGYGYHFRADGVRVRQYCLTEVSAYYRGDIYCRDMIIGVVSRNARSEPCWYCPQKNFRRGRLPLRETASEWYVALPRVQAAD